MIDQILSRFDRQSGVAGLSLYSPLKQKLISLNFSRKKRESFYAELFILLKGDIALYDAVTCLKMSIEKYKTFFKRYSVELDVLSEMIYRLDSGLGSNSIGELLVGLIPSNELVILSVDSRQTVVALEKIGSMMGKFAQLKTEVLKKIATPVLAIFMVIVMAVMCTTHVIPSVLASFPLKQLPAQTQVLFSFCEGLVHYGAIILIVIMLIAGLTYYSLANLNGSVRRYLDYLIPFNLYKQLQATSFLISLSLLLEAGDDFNSSLLKLKANAKPYLLEFINRAQEQVADGLRPGEILSNVGLFNRDTQIYLDIFDSVQRLDQGLQHMSKAGLSVQIQAISRVMNSLSSVCLILAGGFAAWFYIGIASIGLVAGHLTHFI